MGNEMTIIEGGIPDTSRIDPDAVRTAYFQDSYQVRLINGTLDMPDIFFGIFGHNPWWVKALLTFRNRIAGYCGLDVPTSAQIWHAARQPTYNAGDVIGPWPIFLASDEELIVGRDNGHLDFRLSILKLSSKGGQAIAVSTICNTHNLSGRAYLRIIAPFHRAGVKMLLSRAVRSGRL
jgi:hypothetical protein